MAPALLLLVSACGGSGSSTGSSSSGTAGGMTLTARDFAFDPTILNVSPGAQVTLTFHNTGHVEHSFTASSVGADIDADAGDTKTVSFTAPASGSVSFHCKYHPDRMTGTITVSGGGSSSGGGASSGSSSSSSSTGTY
jgi:plastocyanin